MPEKICFQISAQEAGKRIDIVIPERYKEIHRNLVKKYKDNLLVNQKPVKLSYLVKNNDLIEFNYHHEIEIHHLEKEDIPVPIIYEDEYLLIINKPYGMVVHPAKGNWSGTLVNALYAHLSPQDLEGEDLRPGIVHRLDKDTSGLMLFAKNSKTQEQLAGLFADKKVLKVYQALVKGYMKQSKAMIDTPIGRHPKNRLKFTIDLLHGKECLTEYRVLKEYRNASLLEITLHTGRTHQIRVHLSSLKNPIIGDKLYSTIFHENPMCLVSKKIGFTHPVTKKWLEQEIPLPDYMNTVIAQFIGSK
jgi:23S rRNA pseudouridine1911/1915/1917 synthase